MYKDIFKWLNELLNIEPKTFAEHFYTEISEHLNIENETDFNEIMNQTTKQKLITLRNCKSKNEVKIWLNGLTSYILKYLDIENIIEDYIS